MIGIKHSLVVVSITVSHPTQQGQLMQRAMPEANIGVQVGNQPSAKAMAKKNLFSK